MDPAEKRGGNQYIQHKCVPDYIEQDLKDVGVIDELPEWQEQPEDVPKKGNYPKHGKFVPPYIQEDLNSMKIQEEMKSWKKEEEKFKKNSDIKKE